MVRRKTLFGSPTAPRSCTRSAPNVCFVHIPLRAQQVHRVLARMFHRSFLGHIHSRRRSASRAARRSFDAGRPLASRCTRSTCGIANRFDPIAHEETPGDGVDEKDVRGPWPRAHGMGIDSHLDKRMRGDSPTVSSAEMANAVVRVVDLVGFRRASVLGPDPQHGARLEPP